MYQKLNIIIFLKELKFKLNPDIIPFILTSFNEFYCEALGNYRDIFVEDAENDVQETAWTRKRGGFDKKSARNYGKH